MFTYKACVQLCIQGMCTHKECVHTRNKWEIAGNVVASTVVSHVTHWITERRQFPVQHCHHFQGGLVKYQVIQSNTSQTQCRHSAPPQTQSILCPSTDTIYTMPHRRHNQGAITTETTIQLILFEIDRTLIENTEDASKQNSTTKREYLWFNCR